MSIAKITENGQEVVLAKKMYMIVYEYGDPNPYTYTFDENSKMEGVMKTIRDLKNDPSIKKYEIKEQV